MKGKFLTASILVMALALASCSGDDKKKPAEGKKETAASIAQQWCELNGKASKAAYGADQEKAEKAVKAFEDAMEAKYKKDEAFMKEIEKEVEKCEGDSEK